VSGKMFRSFLEQEIFDPSGMKDAQILDRADGIIHKRATGYCFGKQCRQDDGITGPGGVFASLDDMIAWDATLRGAKLFTVGTQLQAMQPGGHALGGRLVTHEGRKAMEHDGAAIGTRTYIVRYSDPQLPIILLSNQPRLDADGLALKIARRFLS